MVFYGLFGFMHREQNSLQQMMSLKVWSIDTRMNKPGKEWDILDGAPQSYYGVGGGKHSQPGVVLKW